MSQVRRVKAYICDDGTEFIIRTREESCADSESGRGDKETLHPGLVQIVRLLAEDAAEEDLRNRKPESEK